MKCPICTDESLVMTERQGIEIDYCPNCRGVWLDRGELDKIIDRASVSATATPTQPQFRQEYRQPSRHTGHYHHKKRKSLLGELFDF